MIFSHSGHTVRWNNIHPCKMTKKHLDVVEHGHWYGGDHGGLLGVVLEDEHHVEVLQTENK